MKRQPFISDSAPAKRSLSFPLKSLLNPWVRFPIEVFALTLLSAAISMAQDPVMHWSMDHASEDLTSIEGPTNPPFPDLPATNPALQFDVGRAKIEAVIDSVLN